jgi:hypothetical protein
MALWRNGDHVISQGQFEADAAARTVLLRASGVWRSLRMQTNTQCRSDLQNRRKTRVAFA